MYLVWSDNKQITDHIFVEMVDENLYKFKLLYLPILLLFFHYLLYPSTVKNAQNRVY